MFRIYAALDFNVGWESAGLLCYALMTYTAKVTYRYPKTTLVDF